MTKEIAVQEQNQFHSLIEKLAQNPDVDVDKMRQIMDMQEHILDRNAEQAFNAAMVRAQSEMPIVPKDKKNVQTNSNYSAYETILKVCKPIYTKYGFSVLFYEGDAKRETEIRIMADVMHEQGHTKTLYVDVPLDNVGIKGTVNKTGTHAKGSSVSYGRSYLMKMIFNIPTGNDDDGNAAGAKTITEAQVNILSAMITDNNLGETYKTNLLKWLKVETFDDLPATDFPKAKRAIEDVLRKKK